MTSPATIDDVHAAAAKVGVRIASDEVEAYHTRLTAAKSALARVLAMSGYYLPVDTAVCPRTNMHYPTVAENVLSVAWAHTFSAKSASPPAF